MATGMKFVQNRQYFQSSQRCQSWPRHLHISRQYYLKWSGWM